MSNNYATENEDVIMTEGGGMVFNPFNPQNREITLNEVQCILSQYGLPTTQINNLELYKRAFVHRSYTKRPQWENEMQNITIAERPPGCLPLHSKSNERLEYLGDGVLELITKYLLYRQFPKANEGFLTEKKIAIVKNEAIGRIALEMGLHKWLIISRHAEDKKIRTNLKKLGCLFESFLGALFLDFNKMNIQDEAGWFSKLFVTGPGFQMAQIFVESIFSKHINWTELVMNDDNYKNILQVKIQKEFKVTPHYLQSTYEGEENEGYKMGVYLCLGQAIHQVSLEEAKPIQHFRCVEDMYQWQNNHQGKLFVFLGKGEHKIKRKAEQEACFNALQYLRILLPDSLLETATLPS